MEPPPERTPEESELPEVLPVRKKGWPIVAWVVIGVLATIIAFGRAVRLETQEPPTTEDPAKLRLMEIEARKLIGAENLLGTRDPSLYRQARVLNTGPVPQRLRFVVLAGELAGAGEALAQLRALDEALKKNNIELTQEQRALRKLLERLYEDYQRQEVKRADQGVRIFFAAPHSGPLLVLPAAERAFEASHKRILPPPLTEAEQNHLRQDLGWFGELALAPQDSANKAERNKVIGDAQQTALGFIVIVVVALLLGLCGLVGLVVLFILWVLGRLQGGLVCGSPYAGVYAETFALWMLLFLGLGIAQAYVSIPGYEMLGAAAASLLSLSALAWPVLRGIPWRQVRQDIGLIPGRARALEPVLGAGVYITALPIVFVGAIITLVLFFLQGALEGRPGGTESFSSRGLPSHPIVEQVIQFSWWGRLQILLLASVVAPIVEETMFRGVLFRQLREATNRFGGVWSFLVSALVVSFLFAVIHPQGLLGVPLLMSLAFAFTLAREWRVTLIPSMVAHGINNGIVMMLLLFVIGG
jgi:membrane protease YdiL (CAAX protease family)